MVIALKSDGNEKKKRVVLCGSMADLRKFREIKKKYPNCIFYPPEDHFERVTETVRATDAPIPNKQRLALILEQFVYIREADEVWVLNEKWIQKEGWKNKAPCEYVGIGTAIDIGYALSLGKKIRWLHRPTDPNLIALFEGHSPKTGRAEWVRQEKLVAQRE